MNSKRILVVVLAMIAALGAAYLASGMLRKDEPVKAAEQSKIDTEKVLVAAQDLSLGSVVASGQIKWTDWPTTALSSSLITQKKSPKAKTELVGSTVRTPFLSGEPITLRRLVKPDSGGFMAAILPKGMRAISVRISPETGAGGFILPNDKVDVLLTRRSGKKRTRATESHVSETILTNVRVLAIDQKFKDNGKDGQVAIGKTATLELKPEQAEVLALAGAMGDLSLTLRSITDSAKNSAGSDGPQFAGSFGSDTNSKRGGTVTMLRYGAISSVNSK